MAIAYLDTHVVVWLCEDNLARISDRALKAINDYYLLISPMVLAELGFLYDIGRIARARLWICRNNCEPGLESRSAIIPFPTSWKRLCSRRGHMIRSTDSSLLMRNRTDSRS